MLRTIAYIFGIIMVGTGFLGFVPSLATDGYLLGLFHINFIHNIVHIATGVVALICGWEGFKASRVFFQVFGLIYGLVALLGFYYGSEPILGIVANNMADNLLHVGVSALSLYLGFGNSFNEMKNS